MSQELQKTHSAGKPLKSMRLLLPREALILHFKLRAFIRACVLGTFTLFGVLILSSYLRQTAESSGEQLERLTFTA